MTRPMTMDEAETRRLLVDAKLGIYTFSNGTAWECWASGNCYDCWHFDPDAVGQCAFESAAFLGLVSPALALLFGWTQDAEYDTPDDHRHGWNEPDRCTFFRRRTNDDGGDNPPPPDPDPLQLVLIADPSEDVAAFSTYSEDARPSLVSAAAAMDSTKVCK